MVVVIALIIIPNFISIDPDRDFTVSKDDDIYIPDNFIQQPNAKNLLASTPKAFTENCGQLNNNEIRFYDQGGSVWFTDDGVWFEIREKIESPELRVQSRESEARTQEPQTHTPIHSHTPPLTHSSTPTQKYKRVILKQEFISVNPVRPIGKEQLGWYSNFFYGNDSSKWRTEVPNFKEIYYENLYNGIDLRYYQNKNGLKYDFIVHPGANVDRIRIKYKGIEKLEINEFGNLVIKTTINNIVDDKLLIYQNYTSMPYPVKGRFKIYNNLEYGFEILQDYNKHEVLVIDPIIEYSTFIGGGMYEIGGDIAVDSNGNVFVTGITNSSDFPTTPGAYDISYNDYTPWDIFVFKLNWNGSQILYSTYIGDAGHDHSRAITIDSNGNAFITGTTNTNGFPTTPGAKDTSYNGGSSDGFVLKLNPTGSDLVYSTFIGGGDRDFCSDITIDLFGNVFVTGNTKSINFPTTPGAYNTSKPNNDADVFILKLNQNGSALLYSTFVGGKNAEGGFSIAINSIGEAFVTGNTVSSDFPTTPGALDTSYNGGFCDVFILKLNQNGSVLNYSTFMGGGDIDQGFGIVIDLNCNAFVTGPTRSSNFTTTPGAYDESYNGIQDAFVLKLDHNGSNLIYSTYIGGSNLDESFSISIDSIGNAFMTGYTDSPNFPTTIGAFDRTFNGSYDGFLFKLNQNGSAPLYSTYIGGNNYDLCGSISVDSIGNAFITGISLSSDFPITPNVFDTSYNGGGDVFVLKFQFHKYISINSLSLLINTTPTNLIYTKLGPYTLRVNVIDTVLLSDVGNVRLTLDPLGTNIQLIWNRTTNRFSKVNDQNNFIIIDSSSKAYNFVNNWIIDFNVIFNWTYPDEEFHDAQVFATSATLSPAWFNATNLYCVENDLVFNGSLVVCDENNNIISENDLVRGGEILNWTGLRPVYENTTDVFPPSGEFDITIWDSNYNFWSASPASGETFTLETVTAPTTNLDGDIHIINISGIPSECDKTNESFIIRTDGDNVTFSNPKPDNKTWHIDNNVEVGITITDHGGGLVDGKNITYSVSNDNGTTWNEWVSIKDMADASDIEIETISTFIDGKNNLIKWKALDTVGNGPVESECYRVMIDTKSVLFSYPLPLKTYESRTQKVEVGINISDNISGVNAQSIEYSTVKGKNQLWSSWKSVQGLKNGTNIMVRLNITFPNGTDNYIKWRASDIAGNGPTESESYQININTWQEKISKPRIELWTPPNGSTIQTTSVELTWRLESIDSFNITYDVFLATVYPPIELNKSNLLDTSLKVTGLSNQQTYYWTVIPRRGTINGTCESGIWSFTVDVPIPKVKLLTPENGSIINSVKPTLSWSVDYNGTEILKYDVYLDTRMDPGMEHKGYSSKYYLPKRLLENGKTYYWKVVPWAGDIKGLESEIWSFTVEIDEIPRFDLELHLEPSVIELKPGSIKYVIANVTNLGDITDSISVKVITPPNVKLGVFVNEPSTRYVVSGDNADFNLTIVTLEDAKNGEIIIEVVASSNKALEYDLVVEKQEKLTIKIVGEEKAEQEKSSYLFVFLNILILIIIIIIILAIAIYIHKRKKKEEEEQEKATPEAVMVKPGELHTAEISIGSAPKPEELPETTEPEEVTEVISPEVPKPQLPGTTPDQETPEAQKTPRLPPGETQNIDNNIRETSQGSTDVTSTPTIVQTPKNEPIPPNN